MIDGHGETTGYVTMREYTRVLRRRWWLVAAGLVLGLVLGTGYARSVAPHYSAVATVAVASTGVPDAATLAGSRTSATINMDNEVQLVTSPSVSAQAATLLRSPQNPFQLAKNVAVTVRANTALMDVTFKARTPLAAEQGAHAFATAYLSQRRVTAANTLDLQITGLKSQVAALSTQLKTVTAQVASLPANSPTKAYAIAQQALLISQLSTVQAKLAPLQITTINPGDIIADAQLPNRPSGLGRKVLLMGGLLLGLLIGLLLAAAAERLDRRLLHAHDLERADLPVFADLSHAAGTRSLAIAPAGSQTGHQWAQLRNRLMAAVPTDRGLTVLVTGAIAGSASTGVALNVAAALARGGFETLLVSLRPESRFDEAIRTEGAPSVSDALQGDLPQPWAPVLPSLRLLTLDAAASDSLTAATLPALHRRLRQLAPYVVLEGPALAEDADVQALAGLVEVVVVTVELRRTTTTALGRTEALLGSVQPRVAGLVAMPRMRSRRQASPRAETSPSADGHADAVARLHGAQ